MKSEREQKVIENLPLVTFILKKYFYDITEDMFQIGCIGLIKAIDTFDESKNISSSTYYSKCIYNEISDEFRRKRAKSRNDDMTLSLQDFVFADVRLEDILEDPSQTTEKTLNKLLVYECYSKLDDVDKFIIKYTFGLFDVEPKDQHEIAKTLGYAQSTISRRIKRILIKMKGMIEDEN